MKIIKKYLVSIDFSPTFFDKFTSFSWLLRLLGAYKCILHNFSIFLAKFSRKLEKHFNIFRKSEKMLIKN